MSAQNDADMKLCFVDTETTSLRPDRRAWEVGLIVRQPDGRHAQHRWLIDAEDLDLGNADLMSLKIGRFYDRHPTHEYPAMPEDMAMAEIERHTRGAHLVGAVVSFDAEVLAARMRAHGICPSWHYHLIDVEALAIGYLAGHGQYFPRPWNSDAITRALELKPVPDDERHTALGDARWAMAIYDAVMAQ